MDPQTDDAVVVPTDDYPLQERLAAHPLSARSVYAVLEHADDPLSIRDCAERLRSPERTVRKGLRHLMNDNLVDRHVLPEDTRRTIYTVAREARDTGDRS